VASQNKSRGISVEATTHISRQSFMGSFMQPPQNNLQIQLTPSAKNFQGPKFSVTFQKQGIFKKSKYSSVKNTRWQKEGPLDAFSVMFLNIDHG